MERMEMTEKLREKTGISYQEAKEALELTEWDLLEAVVYLERQGKVETNKVEANEKEEEKVENAQKAHEGGSKATENMEKVGNWVSRLVEKGNRNRLEVKREDRILFTMPLTVVALVALFAFWFIFPGMLIGWFFGLRYSLEGQDMRGSKEFREPNGNGYGER